MKIRFLSGQRLAVFTGAGFADVYSTVGAIDLLEVALLTPAPYGALSRNTAPPSSRSLQIRPYIRYQQSLMTDDTAHVRLVRRYGLDASRKSEHEGVTQ